MFFQTLANETKDNKNNNIKVLNYAPGPCDTQMVDELITHKDIDNELKQSFYDLKINDKLVKPDDTADCLAEIIMSGDYASGQHIDYYDVSNSK